MLDKGALREASVPAAVATAACCVWGKPTPTANRYAYANTNCYAYGNGNTGANSDTDRYANCNRYANPDSNCYAYCNTNRYTHGNTDTKADCYAYRNADANGYCYAYTHSNCCANRYANANTNTYADARANLRQCAVARLLVLHRVQRAVQQRQGGEIVDLAWQATYVLDRLRDAFSHEGFDCGRGDADHQRMDTCALD